ncbi:MAG: CopG family transcriptional regulator [Pirellulaceae bacterium]|nr:CopG family transcriptional regulator [Pirellulaceae bacterium]
MSDRRRKREIVSFKADAPLMDAMAGISNRSEFIRAAILSALDSVCPLCKGSGILTPDQRNHWVEFSRNHTLSECGDCHALHLVCGAGTEAKGG